MAAAPLKQPLPTQRKTSGPQAIAFNSLSFPSDRKVLMIREVAAVWGVTDQHVVDLIECGKLQAFNTGSAGRKFWRIPVEAYDAFTRANHSYAA